MKKNGWLGYVGDEILPSFFGSRINDEIRIPFNHPVFISWKVGVFFFVAQFEQF